MDASIYIINCINIIDIRTSNYISSQIIFEGFPEGFPRFGLC